MEKVHKTYSSFESQLVKELADLRKGAGLTPAKLQNKPTIRALVSRLTNSPSASITGSQIHAFLVDEVLKTNTTRQGRALCNALGLASATSETLSTRRAMHAAQLKKHPDTIERYENQGLIEFAAQLTNLQPTHGLSVLPATTAYVQHLEEQAAQSRAATALGLSGILSLERKAEELIDFLESSPRPYLDTNIDIAFLPSERGNNWYRMVVGYAFQGRREIFRLAVVTTNEDGERLMKLGLIDEFHKINEEIDPTRETRSVINNNHLTLHDTSSGHQKLLRFKESSAEYTGRLLQAIGEPLLGACRFLEVIVPYEWQTPDTTYEYYSSINLRDDIHYAYWYAPSLMYVKRLSFDYSRFPGAENWQFMALPFLGHIAGDVLDRNKDSFILHPNSWIMPGHGIGLTWE